MRPFLLIVIILMARPAFGQGDGRDQARTLFIRGQEQFDRRQYRKAIESFQQSYALSPRPLLLYDMGLAALLLLQSDEALTYLHRFLATIDHPTPERHDAERLVAKLESERHAPPSPSAEPPPPPLAPAPAQTGPTPPLPTTTPALSAARLDLVRAAPAPATANRRAHQRNLIIGLAAGAAAVAGGVIAIGIVFGTSRGPVPTLGNGHLR
jgi:hypothetical protein